MREHSVRSWASDSSAPDSTVENPVESAIAIAMIRSDSRAAFGNSNPGAVVTSMSSAMRRRSPKAMPRKDVFPDRSRNWCTGSPRNRYGASGAPALLPETRRQWSRTRRACDQEAHSASQR